jgi:hypothetical protein
MSRAFSLDARPAGAPSHQAPSLVQLEMTPRQSAIMNAARCFISASNVKLLIGHLAGACDSIGNLTGEELDEAVALPPGSLYGNDPSEGKCKSSQHIILNAQRTRVCRAGGCQRCCDLTAPTRAWTIFGVLFDTPLSESAHELMIRERGAGGFVVLQSDLEKHWRSAIHANHQVSIILQEEASLAAIFLCHSPWYTLHNPFCPARLQPSWRDITLELDPS